MVVKPTEQTRLWKPMGGLDIREIAQKHLIRFIVFPQKRVLRESSESSQEIEFLFPRKHAGFGIWTERKNHCAIGSKGENLFEFLKIHNERREFTSFRDKNSPYPGA